MKNVRKILDAKRRHTFPYLLEGLFDFEYRVLFSNR
jgi:hypothetical protein